MKRKGAGECDLVLYVMNNPEKRIAETIAKAWELTKAQKEVE